MSLLIKAHGASYRIDDPGGICGEVLREGRPYEWKALERMHSLGLSGTAVDIGAAFGNHALYLAAVCGLRVVAVEPLDTARLQRNVALNDLDITVWPVALGDRAYRGNVRAAPEHVVGEAFAREKVPVARLDDFGLQNVGLMKIDVEGMEPAVLRGAKDTIRRSHPVLYVEAETPAAHERNVREIPRGYEHTGTFGATPLEEWQWRG